MSDPVGFEVASTLDQLLGDLAPMDRLLQAAASEAPDAALLAALDDIGLAELAVPEDLGGLALSLDQLSLVGWVGGRRLMPTLARLWMTLGGPLLAERSPGGSFDGPLACGFPSIASASGATASNATGLAEIWVAEGAEAALVFGQTDCRVVDLRRSDSLLKPRPGVDPGQGHSVLSFDPTATTVLSRATYDATVDRARVMVVAELSGIADRVTEVSVDYARQRSQFGRPLAQFQVIQHKLADMRAGCELIRSAVSRLAWLQDPQPELTASLSTASLTVARGVVEDAIQVHGGMGFAWEYGIHLYYRRCLSLQRQLGGTVSLRRSVGRAMVTRRRVQ